MQDLYIDGERFVPQSTVAEELQVSTATARRYVDQGYVKIGDRKFEFEGGRHPVNGYRFVSYRSLHAIVEEINNSFQDQLHQDQ